MEEAVTRFAKQVNNPTASKVNKERYLLICEQMGHDPDPKVMPLELDDFPEIVTLTLHIYNSLRDTYIPGEIPTYNGKDLSALPVLFDVFDITSKTDKQFIFRLLNIFDTEATIAARKRVEKALNKKPKGPPSIKGGSRV